MNQSTIIEFKEGSPKLSDFKCVKVTWRDCTSHPQSWVFMGELVDDDFVPNNSYLVVNTIGYLVRHDEDVVILASQLAGGYKNPGGTWNYPISISNLVTIPTCSVTKIVYLYDKSAKLRKK